MRAIALSLLLTLPLSADTIYVDKAAAGSGNDGTSWTDAYKRLQNALDNASSGDQIWVAANTYYPDLGASVTDNDRSESFLLLNGVELYGGFAGGELSVAARNLRLNPTILSGEIQQDDDSSNNSYHVLACDNTDGSAVINGFTISDGYADGSGNEDDGGAFLCLDTTGPSFLNCAFTGNSSTSSGGAGLIRASAPSFTNCVFSGNKSVLAGALYIVSSLSFGSADPAFINCTFQGNYATGFSTAGAVQTFDDCAPTFTNCLLWNNQANSLPISVVVFSVTGGTAGPSYSHSLVEGYTALNLDAAGSGGTNNINGSSPTHDPLFIAPIDPTSAPHTGGNLGLSPGSTNVIDAGTNFPNSTAQDVVSYPRILDGNFDSTATIDVGAREYRRPIFVMISAAGLDDGTSWTDAFPSLQEALNIASPGDQIWVGGGAYLPSLETTPGDPRSATFLLQNDLSIYGGLFSGADHVNDRFSGISTTTLSGNLGPLSTNPDNAYHVLTADGVDQTSIIAGFTIIDGNANASVPHNQGGGMLIDDSSLVVTDCHFSDNNATSGGALKFLGNSSPTLTTCSFATNTATNFGGAISNASTGTPVITRSSFAENSASDGGAIINNASAPILEQLTFTRNSATDGGAILNRSSSTPQIINCSFHANTASAAGGAIYNDNSDPVITNTVAWTNRANGLSNTNSSSIFNDTSNPSFSYCIFHNLDLTGSGTGNFDGDSPASDPRFRHPVINSSTILDLRLHPSSPAIDAGDDSASNSSVDLDGYSRLIDGDFDTTATIDLGAYEFQTPLFVDASASALEDGTSWTNAFSLIQNAMAACLPGDLIWVAEGSYRPDFGGGQSAFDRDASIQLKNNVTLYGGFPAGGGSGLFSARNSGTFTSILTGDLQGDENPANNSYHVVTAEDVNNTALIDRFTISYGNADGTGLGNFDHQGAGMNCQNASPTINRCIFTLNAAGQGGGLYFANATVTNSTFTENSADEGGAAATGNNSGTLTNCSFAGNTGKFGGALYFVTNNLSVVTNCAFSGNKADTFGGAIYFSGSTPDLINCSFSTNSADGGGALYNAFDSSPHLINSVIWNNKANNLTTTDSASVASDSPAAIANPEYDNSLVQNFTATELNNSGSGGANNYNGNNAGNNPLFLNSPTPFTAPTTTADLRLLAGSFALDKGDNAANETKKDLFGNDRIQNTTIDLGAYEGVTSANNFASLFPGLDPNADENGNGQSNYHDYAAGADPTAPHDPNTLLSLTDDLLTIPSRINVDDVVVSYEMSDSLLSNDWDPMTLGVDYTASGSTSSGDQLLTTIQILPGPPTAPIMFYRALYSEP